MNVRFSKLVLSVVLIVVLMLPALVVTPLADAQEGPKPVKVELTSYEGNPVLTTGAAGEWDSGFVFAGSVIYKDGIYHMFYAGGEDFSIKPHAIGYATSEDGLHWTKYASNPILKMDTAISQGDIPYALPVVDGDTWVLYFNDVRNLGGVSRDIMRATAPTPTGPWTIDEAPVLESGGSEEWDHSRMEINSVIRDPDQYVLYYYSQRLDVYPGIGMATSPDGVTWTKYNDPATTEPAFANSDPVFEPGESGLWDDNGVIPTVLHTDNGWEMFYMGSGDYGTTWALGYATSPDGIIWTRFSSEPVMTMPSDYFFCLEGILVTGDQYYIYHDMFSQTGADLGVTIGTVTWE
jgi:hypothetical protein